MKNPVKYSLSIAFKIFILLALLVFTSGISFAASQGNKGKTSSGSVDISVHVSQTLNTVSPNELLLNQSNNFEIGNSKPFCIAHHGFNQNAAVPYELKVDNLSSAQPNDAFPYKVFLEDNSALESKLHLTAGISVPKQSNLSINRDIQEICAESGLSLSIEMNEEYKYSSSGEIYPGLMILMVGPI